MAKLHRSLLLKNDPQSTVGGARWSAKRWATDYDRGQRESAAEPIAWESLRSALEWALDSDDTYWRDKITSPGRLFSRLDTIRGQMARSRGNGAADDRESRREYPPGYEPFEVSK